jgi:hypothetical protein
VSILQKKPSRFLRALTGASCVDVEEILGAEVEEEPEGEELFGDAMDR